EALHLGEEVLGLGAVVAARVLELAQELALAVAEVDRGLDGELDVEVARAGAAERGHALAAQAELLAGLDAGGDLHPGLAAVDRRRVDLAAERSRRHRHRDPAVEVLVVALE